MIIKEKDLKAKYDNIDNFNKKLICGDTVSILKRIPSESVDLIITSPSYFLGKAYEEDGTFEDYLELHKEILNEFFFQFFNFFVNIFL